MQDTVLLNKISNSLRELCRSHKIKRIEKLSIIVDKNSNVNSSDLYEYLRGYNRDLVGEWTSIIVEKEQLDREVAILHSIEGSNS